MGTEESPEVKKASKTVGSRLRQEREQLGWTQSELAERIGTTQFNVSRWEHSVTVPGPYNRQKLGKLFGKSLQELGFIKETEEESAEQKITGLSPQTNQNIPHRRNPFFTGREDILHNLSIALAAHKPTALTQAQAISGLGGIGKTQIAVEYVYRYGHLYDVVLWVTASSRDTLVNDFMALAGLLDLPEQKEQEQDTVIAAVKRWLATHKNWLLILDNVDDLEMVMNFLPIRSQGSILLTTQSQALGSLAQNVEVKKMEPNEGMLFLLRRAKILTPEVPLDQASGVEQAQAKEIVDTLDALPLALDQAGAYIEETRCGLQGYLDLYHVHRTALLQRRGKLSTDHPESVSATWSLSFQRVEQANLAAADLLRLCAFLGAEAIPEEIIIKGAVELGPELGSVAADPLALNEVIEHLLRYSLIRRDSQERSLGIHRLVQAVLRDAMDINQQRIWAERALRATNCAFPDVEPATWDTCRRCLPHAQLCATYIEKYCLTFPEAAHLLNKAAIYLMDHAHYTEVKTLLRKALTLRQQLLKPDHPDVAATLHDLGKLYYVRGKYAEAELYLQQALAIRTQVLGTEHPHTASSLTHLAEVYTAQGKYELAEPLYLKALNMQKQALQTDHPDMAKTLNDLALFYRSKGEYARSELLYREALELQEGIWGFDHPDVAQTLNNLARLYRAQGEYDKAEPCYLRALDIRKRIFGPDHPDVAQGLHSLGKLYYSQGKYLQAEELCQQALHIQEQWLGLDHPSIAYTLGILAKIAHAQQDDTQAEEYYKRALAIRESTLGSGHPLVAALLSSLAEVYQAQGKYDAARPLIERSLGIREHTLGREHPYFAYSLSNLAENYSSQGDYTQAESLYKQALAIRERVLGAQHPQTASTYHHLANLYLTLDRYAEAESLYQQALAIRERTLGPGHPDVATTLEWYAQLLRKTERAGRACEFEARAKAIRASQ
jgi:tetratricopeptide (TPR) repeat protein/transcriptional regulator with XRE-family HTH domain